MDLENLNSRKLQKFGVEIGRHLWYFCITFWGPFPTRLLEVFK